MNKTEEIILSQLHANERTWEKVKDNLQLISIKQTSRKNYGIFYDNTFLGIFIPGSMIDINELTTFTLNKGMMEH